MCGCVCDAPPLLSRSNVSVGNCPSVGRASYAAANHRAQRATRLTMLARERCVGSTKERVATTPCSTDSRPMLANATASAVSRYPSFASAIVRFLGQQKSEAVGKWHGSRLSSAANRPSMVDVLIVAARPPNRNERTRLKASDSAGSTWLATTTMVCVSNSGGLRPLPSRARRMSAGTRLWATPRSMVYSLRVRADITASRSTYAASSSMDHMSACLLVAIASIEKTALHTTVLLPTFTPTREALDLVRKVTAHSVAADTAHNENVRTPAPMMPPRGAGVENSVNTRVQVLGTSVGSL